MVLAVARQDAVGVDLLLIGGGEVFHDGTGVQPIWTCHGGDQTEQQEESGLHLGFKLSGGAVWYQEYSQVSGGTYWYKEQFIEFCWAANSASSHLTPQGHPFDRKTQTIEMCLQEQRT